MNERATPSLDDVLARIAVRGTDPEAVIDYTMGLIARRSRRRRALGGAAVVLAVIAITASAVMGNSDQRRDEVVTPANSVTSTMKPAGSDETLTTTSQASMVTNTTLALVTAPTMTTTVTTATPVPTIAAPPVAATPPPNGPQSIPADRPGSGVLVVNAGAAGELLDLRFEFNDPDGPGVSPVMWIHTDEPGTVEPRVEQGTADSCSGGPGTHGKLHEPVQFASTGLRRVWVTVKYCNALPSVFSTSVDVAAPRFGDLPGRAVMAELPGDHQTYKGDRWQFHTDGGETLTLVTPTDGHSQVLEPVAGFQLRGVVIVLPAASEGELALTTGGPAPRTYTGRVAATESGRAATRVRMTPS